ncbi:17080_t:CDS:2 [Acaulospora morrowiae]|uniref:17080_t:CDS:1 n=1 Tax=Acaulospora morrowiae TaxID=94023 RepID=A0A9N9F905_9GLOM|nr:17080_t:CDS:2 [Acaulospora morrowiae]
MPKSKGSQTIKGTKAESSSLSKKNLKLNTPSISLLPKCTRKSTMKPTVNTSTFSSTDPKTGEKVEFADKTMRAYIILAESCGWKNVDGTIFPISVANLCNYIRTKKSTNNLQSIKWYLTGFKKYHQNFLHNREWDAVCKHPDVIDLLNEHETEETTKRAHGISNNENLEKSKIREQQSINGYKKSVEFFTELEFPSVNFEFSEKQICGSQGLQSLGSIPTFMNGIISQSTSVIVNTTESNDEEREMCEDSPQVGNGSPRKSIALRRSHRIGNSKSEDLYEEPLSFRSRFKAALVGLKAKYSGHCSHHPKGCFLVGKNRHFIITDQLFKRWASLCASGEDVTINHLPDSEDLTEFSVKNAVWII